MALYWPIPQFYVCVYASFVCRYVAPLVSVITTLYYVAIIFDRQVWYRAVSLRYACNRSSDIILIP